MSDPVSSASRGPSLALGVPTYRKGVNEARITPLWLLLVGRAAVRRNWHLLLIFGLVCTALGIVVVIDSLDGALHVPDRWFGLLLLAEGLGSLLAGTLAAGAARRLRLLKGVLLCAMAVLIVAATRHSVFLLAMIFGTAFLVDGAIRIVIACILKFSGWRSSAALGALGVAFGLFHLQPWPTWYAGTVGYCVGMFLLLNGARFALASLRTRRLDPCPTASPSPMASRPGLEDKVPPDGVGHGSSLQVHVWTPTGQATTPARQRLMNRYVASVDARGVLSTGHAALELGTDLYISHYPAVEIDRSSANLRSNLSAGPENDVPGRFLPSYREEAADWCEATLTIRLSGIDDERLRMFWADYRRDPTYNFIGRNCSTAVALALDAAVEGALARTGHPWRQLAKAMTSPEFWAAAVLRNGAAGMTWTPGLVLDYSRALSTLIDPDPPMPGIAWTGVVQQIVGTRPRKWLPGLPRLARRRPAANSARGEA